MRTPLFVILLLQTIGGGSFGALMSWSFAASAPSVSPLASIVVMCLFAGVLAAGLSLAIRPDRKWPMLLAMAVQTLWISTPGFHYKLGAGFSLWLVSLEDQGPFWINLGADSALGPPVIHPWGAGLNFVAIALFILVWRSRRPPLVPLDAPATVR